MESDSKKCPYCKEYILTDAIKCKHCQSMLTEPPAVSHGTPVDATIPLDDMTIPLSDVKRILGGRYELIGILGKGGMGVVHKAYDKELEIDVAIKLLPEFLARDARGVGILKTEARASIKLSHPNVIKLFNFEDHPDGKFLIMEFIDGKTLDEILDEHPGHRMPEEELVKYAIEACQGLEYAHSKGVIHRDIKPSNIMVESAGHVKITDFGIARVVKESHTRQTGATTSGTLLYMSPEQIRGKRCDARSDIYSFGIMLYELLTGNVPFLSGDITHQHLNEEPAAIEEISQWLNAVVLKCLEKEPEDRFQSVRELIVALETGSGISAPPIAGLGRTEPPQGESARAESASMLQNLFLRRLPQTVAAGLVVMLAVGLFYYSATKRDEPPTTTLDTEDVVVAEKEPEHQQPELWEKAEAASIDTVVTARLAAESALESARAANAVSWFPELMQEGESKYKESQEYEKKGERESALKAYEKAVGMFNAAKSSTKRILLEKGASDDSKKLMEQARTDAKKVNARTHALQSWQEGESHKKRGEELYQGREYVLAEEAFRNAMGAYGDAIELSKTRIVKTGEEEKARVRVVADKAKTQAKVARSSADAVEADKYAMESYTHAQQKFARGESKYIEGDFAAASALYREAIENFGKSEQEAKKHGKLPAGLEQRGGKIFSIKDGAGMILVPAGEFTMGSPAGEGNDDERPMHRVHIDAFYMDEHEVTVGQYRKFMYATGHSGLPSWASKYSPGDNYPVVGVSWKDAVAYAEWAGKRLPTEAEYEKAARGVDGRKYPWGIGEPDGGGSYRANYNPGEYTADGYEYTSPVGSFENGRSPYGIYDLSGNVAEWCSDWYDTIYYKNSERSNPKGPSIGSERVVRGGSWRGYGGLLRSAGRGFFRPSEAQIDVGFRCVKDSK